MGLRQSCWNCRLLEGGGNRSSRSDREGKWISDRDAGTGGEVDLRQRSWNWNWYLLGEEFDLRLSG